MRADDEMSLVSVSLASMATRRRPIPTTSSTTTTSSSTSSTTYITLQNIIDNILDSLASIAAIEEVVATQEGPKMEVALVLALLVRRMRYEGFSILVDD